MRRLALLIAAFAYMVLLIEAVRAAAAWWRGEAALTALDYALVAALPLLAWVWFRYFSMFRKGCAKGVCAPPGKPSGE
ncbi:MAG: hypothetical protein K8F56_14515 [Rhodocyclaceae bacterium]|jgi:hypothetical protein|nr:hypothetical protein [Rhodocyclaceae bacterium]